MFQHMCGIILVDFPPCRQYINVEYYSNLLIQIRYVKLLAKRDIKKFILLHDNAESHMANLTMKTSASTSWKIMVQPLYNPDQHQVIYTCLVYFKIVFWWVQIHNDQLMYDVRQWLLGQDTSFTGYFRIEALSLRWK